MPIFLLLGLGRSGLRILNFLDRLDVGDSLDDAGGDHRGCYLILDLDLNTVGSTDEHQTPLKTWTAVGRTTLPPYTWSPRTRSANEFWERMLSVFVI